MPVEKLGPYHITKTVGRGGMGTVYAGRHEETGELVAVKILATGLEDDPRFRTRFSAEIETLKKLKPIIKKRQEIATIDREINNLKKQQRELDQRANQTRQNLEALKKDKEAFVRMHAVVAAARDRPVPTGAARFSRGAWEQLARDMHA